MEKYLHDYHLVDIIKILESPKKAKIHEILLDLTLLKENAKNLFDGLMKTTDYNKIANKWIKAIKNVQQEVKDTRDKLALSKIASQLDVEKTSVSR